ncbi:OmpA family protein [Brevibacterium album]|uniref:OmpA family protein n=1 Tax=Brevibacterium album TaxID=417948 RepID=UPI0003FA0B67|nr:OmpA family protein [Brevibacterium album]
MRFSTDSLPGRPGGPADCARAGRDRTRSSTIPRRSAPFLSVLVAAAAVVGCSGAPEHTQPEEQPAPETEVAELAIAGLGGDRGVAAALFPIAREGDTATLTFDLTANGSERVDTATAFGATASPPLRPPEAIRLFDAKSDLVLTAALDSEGAPVSNEGWRYADPDGRRVQIAFAAPSSDSVAVMLPGAAMTAEVPVIDAEAPEAPGYDALGAVAEDVYAPADIAEAPAFAVGTYTTELDGAVALLDDTEHVEVTLDTDILFDFGSAEIREGSQPALDRAAQIIDARAAGPVQVTGHTDDIGSHATNQELSEDRASAVVTALAPRLANDQELIAEGRSFREPVADNDTDAGRAQNRRVTIAIEEPSGQAVRAQEEGELPEFDAGPVASGSEGVSLGDFTVTAPRAYELGDYLVVELEVTSHAADGAHQGRMFSGAWSHRGSGARYPSGAVSGVAVVAGTTKTYPADYLYGSTDTSTELWGTVSDLSRDAQLFEGQSQTASIVYAGVEDVTEVTVQLDHNLGNAPFRLTGIPVER